MVFGVVHRWILGWKGVKANSWITLSCTHANFCFSLGYSEKQFNMVSQEGERRGIGGREEGKGNHLSLSDLHAKFEYNPSSSAEGVWCQTQDKHNIIDRQTEPDCTVFNWVTTTTRYYNPVYIIVIIPLRSSNLKCHSVKAYLPSVYQVNDWKSGFSSNRSKK